MKKLLLLLLLPTLTFASRPVRDDNGCTIGTEGAKQTTIPWYLVEGEKQLDFTIYDLKCPPIDKEITEIKIPFGRVVGHLESVFSDVYITVPTQNEVKFFPTRDVFVESTKDWSFKDLRGNK